MDLEFDHKIKKYLGLSPLLIGEAWVRSINYSGKIWDILWEKAGIEKEREQADACLFSANLPLHEYFAQASAASLWASALNDCGPSTAWPANQEVSDNQYCDAQNHAC